MKKIFEVSIAAIIFILAIWSPAQSSDKMSLVFFPGEEYRYSVKWGFIRLGTITIQTLEYESGEDEGRIRISMLVESNPSIPFVKIREYNETLLDVSTLGSLKYRGDFKNGRERTLIRTSYTEDTRTARYQTIHYTSGDTIQNIVLQNITNYVDGPSLLAFTRVRSCTGGVYELPTMVNGEIQTTIIDFTDRIEEIRISAWPFPVRSRKYTGTADWQGGTAQGLGGKFTGWISDDFAAVIIRADMKVILGSVRVELESWDRPDWTPSTSQRTVKR
jgi:hypothetical protein